MHIIICIISKQSEIDTSYNNFIQTFSLLKSKTILIGGWRPEIQSISRPSRTLVSSLNWCIIDTPRQADRWPSCQESCQQKNITSSKEWSTEFCKQAFQGTYHLFWTQTTIHYLHACIHMFQIYLLCLILSFLHCHKSHGTSHNTNNSHLATPLGR